LPLSAAYRSQRLEQTWIALQSRLPPEKLEQYPNPVAAPESHRNPSFESGEWTLDHPDTTPRFPSHRPKQLADALFFDLPYRCEHCLRDRKGCRTAHDHPDETRLPPQPRIIEIEFESGKEVAGEEGSVPP